MEASSVGQSEFAKAFLFTRHIRPSPPFPDRCSSCSGIAVVQLRPDATKMGRLRLPNPRKVNAGKAG